MDRNNKAIRSAICDAHANGRAAGRQQERRDIVAYLVKIDMWDGLTLSERSICESAVAHLAACISRAEHVGCHEEYDEVEAYRALEATSPDDYLDL